MEDLEKSQAVKKDATLKGLWEWGQQARFDSDWLRSQSPKYGLDPRRMVLGHVLRTIVSDDSNSFLHMHTFITDPDMLKSNQSNTVERLSWEIDLPEIPDDLKEKLKAVYEVISISDWTDKDSFAFSKETWKKMQDELWESSQQEGLLKDALDYYETNHLSVPPAGKYHP